MNESELQQLIQIDAVQFGCHLLRNNSGAFKDLAGRFVFFGLGNISKQHSSQIKSSDLIGFTWSHGGAIFTAVEVKKPGWKPDMLNAREAAQNAFIQWVKKNGGYAGFASSVEQFRRIIGR